MKSISVLIVLLAALAIWVVAGCNDQTRHNCDTDPTAPRCQVTP